MSEAKTIKEMLAEPVMEEWPRNEIETVGMDGQKFMEMQTEFWPLGMVGIEVNVIIPAQVPEEKRRELYAKVETAFKAASRSIVREWAKSKA